MNRALTLAAVLPAVRLIVDAGDAVAELAERFGVRDLAVLRSVGGWDLEADVDLHRFGLGVLVEHLPPRTATHPDWSMAGVVVGPLMLSVTRRRTAAQRLDDTVGPVGDFDCCLAEAADELTGQPIDRLVDAAAGRYDP